ncbi:MAG: hypothetical protein FWC43_09125 [Planctomycetaceae bacterium]|nr:hypothetical protein [Planctomycetaceae bacterium]
MRNKILSSVVCRLSSVVLPAVCCLPAFFDFCVAQTASVSFSGVELRETLNQYAKTQRVGFLLDRRIDPGQPLKFEAQKVAGMELFVLLADQMKLGFCQIGPIAYLGPKEAAVKLERIHAIKRQALSNSPTELRRMLSQKIRLKTEKLDTPLEILHQVSQKMKTKIVNPDRIPHDLWPELDFPEADACELLSVLLIGFDLTFEIGDRGITFVPLPDNLPVVTETKPNRPKATSSSKKEVPLEKQRFQSFEVQNKTVNEVLQYFSDNWDLQITVDEKSLRDKGISLDERISFQRNQTDIHDLLRATLDPVGCTYQLSGKKLRVFSGK